MSPFRALASDAAIVLYFVEEKLIAFNLVIIKPDVLVDKYFSMELVLGRKYNLYFVSWLENVRFCIENRIPLYHVGQGAERTKAYLAAKFIPSAILFRHRNPIIHRFLTAAKHYLSYRPAVDIPEAWFGQTGEADSSINNSKISTGIA